MRNLMILHVLAAGVNVARIQGCVEKYNKFERFRCANMEQRVLTRYRLQVPAHVETMISGGDVRSYEWKTRDVSSRGAFLLTNGQLVENGTDIKVNLYLNSFSGSGSWVAMNGRVVRVESEGVGVCFNGQYQFSSNEPGLEM